MGMSWDRGRWISPPPDGEESPPQSEGPETVAAGPQGTPTPAAPQDHQAPPQGPQADAYAGLYDHQADAQAAPQADAQAAAWSECPTCGGPSLTPADAALSVRRETFGITGQEVISVWAGDGPMVQFCGLLRMTAAQAAILVDLLGRAGNPIPAGQETLPGAPESPAYPQW